MAALARSSGSDQAGGGAVERDASIYEYVAPLRAGENPERVAWKRWAATGIPAQIVTGQSRSSALRLVLDLRPCSPRRAERLQAEDRACSAVFSVLGELVRQEIPVELILGGEDRGILVDCGETFQRLFDASTNLLFTDHRFPAAAFAPFSAGGTAAFLITTRPIVESGGDDLFTLYEECLAKGTEPHLLVCPPESKEAEVRRSVETLAELQIACGSRTLMSLADSEGGTKELANALRL